MENKELLEFEDEKIEEAYLSLEIKKEEKDTSGIYDSLLLLISRLEKSGDYRTIINIIDENLDLITDENYLSVLLSTKIQSLLKIEEYNELLKTLDEKSRLSILKDVDKTNILFYKAIAFEALDEIELSIKSLESIDDFISKYSLVNKYLKLTLLYIRVNRLEDAKKAYEYADLIDHNHKNDMFILAESDLYFSSKKYQEALDSFEIFFLKSPNKYKYLDRYIRINIELDRLNEAYNFYLKYKDNNNIKLSSQNKYSFFKAARELLIILNRKEEIEEVNAILENLKPTYFKAQEKERLSLINAMISSMSYPLTKYDKYKNIANKFFKILNSIEKKTLIFIEKCDDGIKYSLFKNTQLREKLLSFSMLHANNLLSYFLIEEDSILDYYYNEKLEKVEETVKVYTLKTEYKDYGYFIVSYNQDYLEVYDALRNVLIETFLRLDAITKNSQAYNSILKSLNDEEVGFISITSKNVEFLNSYARELFGFGINLVDYNDFIKTFYNSLGPDDFLKERDQNQLIRVNDKEKLINIKSNIIDNIIYAFIKDISKNYEKEREVMKYYNYSNLKFKNINSLKADIENEDKSYALIGIYIPIIEGDDTLLKRDNKLNITYDFLNEAFSESTLYYLGENHFLYKTYKIDKRIIEALFSRIKEGIKSLYKYSYSLRINKISGFASKALKTKTYFEITELMEYGFYYSFEKEDFIILDNIEKKNYQIYKVYDTEIANRIKEGRLDIEFYPIVNASTNEIHYFMAKYIVPYDISYSMFERIIERNQLETKIDYNLFEKVFELSKELNKGFRFILPIHKESVTNSNFVKKLSLLYKSSSLNERIIVHVESLDFLDYKKHLDSIKNSGLKLSTSYKDISSVKDLNNISIVFMNYGEDNDYTRYLISGVKEILKKEVVVVGNAKIDGALNLSTLYKPLKKDKLLDLKVQE